MFDIHAMIDKIQHSYTFRITKCPACGHEFMYRKDIDNAYKPDWLDGFAYRTRCTKCQENLFLIDGVYQAVKYAESGINSEDTVFQER